MAEREKTLEIENHWRFVKKRKNNSCKELQFLKTAYLNVLVVRMCSMFTSCISILVITFSSNIRSFF